MQCACQFDIFAKIASVIKCHAKGVSTRTFDFDRLFGEQMMGCADGFHLAAFGAGDLTLIVIIDVDFSDRHADFPKTERLLARFLIGLAVFELESSCVD